MALLIAVGSWEKSDVSSTFRSGWSICRTNGRIQGPMACSIISQEFYETDPNRDFVRGYGLHGGRFTTPMTFALGGYGMRQFDALGLRSTGGNSTKFILIVPD